MSARRHCILSDKIMLELAELAEWCVVTNKQFLPEGPPYIFDGKYGQNGRFQTTIFLSNLVQISSKTTLKLLKRIRELISRIY